MQKVYLPELNQEVKKLSDQIKILLKEKFQLEKLKFEPKNKIFLGGVNFWFQVKEQENEKLVYFLYDRSPEVWDIDRIKNDLFNMQDFYYRKYNIALF